jgi:hypothetical protein
MSKLILRNLLVDVAPQPSFARLGGRDHGMMDLMIMCGHVPHGRIIAAERNATGLAGAQVHPCGARFDAFHANQLFSGLDVGDCAQVFAYMSVLAHI